MRRICICLALTAASIVSGEAAQAQFIPSYGYQPGLSINFGYNSGYRSHYGPSYGSRYGGYLGRYDYVPPHVDRHHGHSHFVPGHVDYIYRGRRYPVTTDMFGRTRVMPYPHRD